MYNPFSLALTILIRYLLGRFAYQVVADVHLVMFQLHDLTAPVPFGDSGLRDRARRRYWLFVPGAIVDHVFNRLIEYLLDALGL
ncbi:hypothetical protein LZ30DRAFT_696615 [Colletotrichum cereale]|nr:hypothetical protein LZ30DRAFT_696615 [Colletotrichum cereale]